MDNRRSEFERYFSDIMEALDAEFKKSNEYSMKIDAEIAKFDNMMASKGGQHYLVSHMENAIALQSQRQSLIKDKFNIKKAVLDYAMKNQEDENAGKNLFDELSRIIKMDKQRIEAVVNAVDEKHKKESEALDKAIEERLTKEEAGEDE